MASVGELGNDCLQGYAGTDILFGNSGSDTLWGEIGNDILYGGQGEDWLHGGGESDILQGDRGNDTLTGSDGGDRFDFRRNDGSDTITDFQHGLDIIGLKEGLTFEDLAIVQAGNDTQIGIDGSLLVTLMVVSTNTLTIDDFALV